MKECITAREIPKKVKVKLPGIPRDIVQERACAFCPYHGGLAAGEHRCMVRVCAWDEENVRFHPAFKEALPKFKADMEKTKARYEKALRKYGLLLKMMEPELRREAREQDECYGCPYSKGGPCIGICYKKLQEKGERS